MSNLSICSSSASSSGFSGCSHQEHPHAGGIQVQFPVLQLPHSHGGLEPFAAEHLHCPALLGLWSVRPRWDQELAAELVAHVQPQAARCAVVHAGEVDLDKHEVVALDQRR